MFFFVSLFVFILNQLYCCIYSSKSEIGNTFIRQIFLTQWLTDVGTMLDLLVLNTKSECVLKPQVSNQTMPGSLVKSQLAFAFKHTSIRKNRYPECEYEIWLAVKYTEQNPLHGICWIKHKLVYGSFRSSTGKLLGFSSAYPDGPSTWMLASFRSKKHTMSWLTKVLSFY